MTQAQSLLARRPGKAGSDIKTLMARLANPDLQIRQDARETLVSVGLPAVAALTQALSSRCSQVRWEAVKALVDIPHASAIPALIRTLNDEDGGIRWLAAEALIAIGPVVIPSLLAALVDRDDSPEFRQGAHHVLHELQRRSNQPLVGPVLAALEGPAPETAVPVAANTASRQLSQSPV